MYSQEEQRALFDLSKEYLKPESQVYRQSADQQYSELSRLIVYHEWRYYILNDPVISDPEYDQLFKKLEALEEAHPGLVTPDSPTQRVSADLTSDFPEVEHLTPMLSLANSYNEADLFDFDRQIKKLGELPETAEVAYAVEPKYDGSSIALVYEDDTLLRGATRGNGTTGEEITNNVRVIRSIPLRSRFSAHGIRRVEVRGEVLIRKDVFRQVNATRAEEGLSLFANARNTAAGGLRMKNPQEVSRRGLEAFIYTLGYAVDADGDNIIDRFDTHYESLDLLDQLGFKVPRHEVERKRCRNIREVVDFCHEWQAKREDYPYEIDGMVVKVDSRALQEKCGYTSHHPRWAIAFKFQAKQATTRLLSVEYQVGKVGSITPVAKLEPVQLAGVTISSVSLHNEDFVREKDLHTGDMVLVERAGDVIPYIVKAMPELRDGSEQKIEFPKFCPINDTGQPVELVRAEGEAAWRCPVCVCGAQDLQRIIFHVSKNAMDIEGLGRSIVERFYELGWLRTIADIYRLDYERVAELEGFGEKSAANLKKSIEKAKQQPLHRLLHSLSIHHLGQKVSKILAGHIDHVLDLQKWTLEDFVAIKEIGPVLAENVMKFFAHERNVTLLKELEELGVNVRPTPADQLPAQNNEGPLAGKTILFTGSLQNLTRGEAKTLAEGAGARALSGVSSKLDILVVGEKAGSKLKKAQELGTVDIWTEAEFLEKVKNN